MRIGVISDTHVKTEEDLDRLTEIVHCHFKEINIILHSGDMVDLRVLEVLKDVAKTVAVRGNMDFPDTKKVLPEKIVVEVGGCKIGMMHGWGSPVDLPQRVRREFSDVDCIVFGHSHSFYNQVIDNVLLFNPGSAMDRAFTGQNSLGFLDIDESTDKNCGSISGKIVKI
ncbi:MAG TPA: metallophosphoesterase [Actinobacteria bacterium]|nr:metallophosphoesterase [Actinomycetota bacterium]